MSAAPPPAAPTETSRSRDALAYIMPMAAFLLLTQAEIWWPIHYISLYVLKTLAAAALLAIGWKSYTPIRWNYWWLGALLGIVGVVQWVGMEKLLLHSFPHYLHASGAVFNPVTQIDSPAQRWSFILFRWAAATLVVPVMEELFWRDFAWRSIIAPADFKLAAVGEMDWSAILLVSLLFCSVHVQWVTALVWGLMIGGLLVWTRSLGACIVMHAATNFFLGLYVLRTGDWYFW